MKEKAYSYCSFSDERMEGGRYCEICSIDPFIRATVSSALLNGWERKLTSEQFWISGWFE
jgi:hypothetical protein